MPAQLADSCLPPCCRASRGQYTLRPKLQAVVDSILGLAGSVTGLIDNAMALVDYGAIHPLYLQAKGFICCDVVNNVFGDLWLSMLCAGAMSVVLIISMILYIRRLDELPSKRQAGFPKAAHL